jgi:hypothetical protein
MCERGLTFHGFAATDQRRRMATDSVLIDDNTRSVAPASTYERNLLLTDRALPITARSAAPATPSRSITARWERTVS